MAWDGKKLPDALAVAATNAATLATNGNKNTAYLTYIRDQIGTNFLMKLLREDVVVWQATATGALTISGSRFVLPTTATQNSISNADIDTGEWILRVENATDPTKYISAAVTPTAGAGPFRLSSDLISTSTVNLGSMFLNSPGFDGVTASGLTATAITSSAATLSVVIAGAIPAGSQMQIQVTTSPTTGPWLESDKPAAATGTFSHTFTGLSSGLTHHYRAFVYTEVGNGQPAIIHAQSETVTFVTESGSTPGTGDVDTMVFHMTINDPAWTPNGGPNNPYMKGGGVATGGDSRSNALPTWYGSTTNQYLTQNGYGPANWNTLQPWYVVWDATGHVAGLNVVCVWKDLELWWLGDGMSTWQRLSISPSPGGDPFQRDIITQGGNVSYGTYPDGLRWAKLSPTGSVFHGYQGQITTGTNGFDTTKIIALQTRIKTRIQLEDPNGANQLSQARYLMQAGLDLYPFSGAPLPPDGYWPGCMTSRWQPVTTSWQTVYATNLASAYNVDNNSRASGGYSFRQKISEAAFRANPPPVS